MLKTNQIELLVGRHIRDFRHQRGLTLADLASTVQLTKGQLSKIENGHVSPSLGTLAKIADSLGVELSVLTKTRNQEAPITMVAKSDLRSLPTRETESGLIYRSLGSDVAGMRSFVPYNIRIEKPDYTIDGKYFKYPGQGFIHLVRGKLEFHYHRDVFVLRAGDSIAFNADCEHGPAKVLEGPVEYILVLSNPVT